MKEKLFNILDNESLLGRITGRIWIAFAVNVLFLLCAFPVVTAGPALAAMYTVTLKMLRTDPDVQPVRTYLKAFWDNFRQAFVIWLALLGLGLMLAADIAFCVRAEGLIAFFRYPLYVLLAVWLLIVCHIFPVIAAFEDTWKGQLRNAVYFISKNPLRSIGILLIHIGPLLLTYSDLQRLPLYAFIWTVCGFSVIAMTVSRWLLKDFARHLPEIEEPAGPEEQ